MYFLSIQQTLFSNGVATIFPCHLRCYEMDFDPKSLSADELTEKMETARKLFKEQAAQLQAAKDALSKAEKAKEKSEVKRKQDRDSHNATTDELLQLCASTPSPMRRVTRSSGAATAPVLRDPQMMRAGLRRGRGDLRQVSRGRGGAAVGAVGGRGVDAKELAENEKTDEKKGSEDREAKASESGGSGGQESGLLQPPASSNCPAAGQPEKSINEPSEVLMVDNDELSDEQREEIASRNREELRQAVRRAINGPEDEEGYSSYPEAMDEAGLPQVASQAPAVSQILKKLQLSTFTGSRDSSINYEDWLFEFESVSAEQR